MNWFKKIFHTCQNFRWDLGYGITRYGRGTYKYKVCADCNVIIGDIKDFVKEEDESL